MLKDIELEDVKYQQSKTLSGGQKRKLSVAIAMIGNSKIVLLDEQPHRPGDSNAGVIIHRANKGDGIGLARILRYNQISDIAVYDTIHQKRAGIGGKPPCNEPNAQSQHVDKHNHHQN